MLNQSLESIQPLLKTDSTALKDVLMPSIGRGNQHKESTLMNNQEEAAMKNQQRAKIFEDTFSDFPG